MTLSPLSYRSAANLVASVILAPLAIVTACYAPALATTETQDKNAHPLLERPPIVGSHLA